jgi:Cd2+/Zn2+-exporting ATPase
MSRARCTLHVHGLDCPSEADAVRAVLGGAPGILGLAFDLMNGTVTID